MPLQSPPATLQAIIQPVNEIRDDSECRVVVASDTIRVRAVSQDRSVALDYSIPLTDQTVEDTPADFWITVDPVRKFLKTRPRESVTITFPFETTDGRVVLRSNGLTHRFAPFYRRAKHRLVNVSHQDSPTVCSLQHKDFVRSLTVADLIADALTIEFCPSTQRVTFKAEGSDGDSFTYSPPVETVATVGRSTTPLTISTDGLLDLMSLIADDCLGTFELSPDFLTYRVEHPVPGAEFTLAVARRTQTVQ